MFFLRILRTTDFLYIFELLRQPGTPVSSRHLPISLIPQTLSKTSSNHPSLSCSSKEPSFATIVTIDDEFPYITRNPTYLPNIDRTFLRSSTKGRERADCYGSVACGGKSDSGCIIDIRWPRCAGGLVSLSNLAERCTRRIRIGWWPR